MSERRILIDGKGVAAVERPDLRARAMKANALVRQRARHHTQTETVAFTRVNGQNASVNVLAFQGNPPLGREVLVFREHWARWVDPQLVVIERTA